MHLAKPTTVSNSSRLKPPYAGVTVDLVERLFFFFCFFFSTNQNIHSRAGFNTFIFHDVDLLPSPELLPSYTTPAPPNPIHIARVWSRYSNNAKYFGGIVSFSGDSFEKLNGFPNNFWGWGGEDDELQVSASREMKFKGCTVTNLHY